MKMKTTRACSETERLELVRSMVLGFRSRTLSIADHREISSWLEESEQNQQLFEKWITDPRYRNGENGKRGTAIFSMSQQGLRRRIFFFLLLAVLVAWLIYRINR